jgi:hypothetical protein
LRGSAPVNDVIFMDIDPRRHGCGPGGPDERQLNLYGTRAYSRVVNS